jgi:NAD-reducing hydrogenase small subunit
MIKLARERSRFLVALGDCATTSNISAMRNLFPVKAILDRVYVEGADVQQGIPTQGVPALLKHAIPLHDVVKIDLHVPGCPPSAPAILFVVTELLEGRVPDLRTKMRFG